MGWINHRQVEAFHVVMLTGSMTAAGEMLGITQPAISRLIRELEAKVGFALFRRNGGNISPTPEGETLHREVERSMQALSRIEAAAEGIVQLKSETLRISGTIGLSTAYVARAIQWLEEKYPDATLTVSVDTTPAMVDKLRANQFDVGVAFFPGDLQGLEIEALNLVEAVCVMPAGHPLAARAEIHVEDLAGVPLICQEMETQTQYKIMSVFRAAGVEPTIRIEANLALMMYKLVEAGAGVAVTEPITAKEMAGRPIEIRPFRPAVQFVPGIAFPAHRPPSRIARDFAALFTELFAADFGGV